MRCAPKRDDLRRVGGEHERERRSLFWLRLHLDSSAEELGQAARDVESKAGAAVAPREAGVELGEGPEEPLEVLASDADPCIANRVADLGTLSLELESHLAHVRELDGVAGEVHEN